MLLKINNSFILQFLIILISYIYYINFLIKIFINTFLFYIIFYINSTISFI